MKQPSPEVLRTWTALLVAHRRLTSALDAELRESCGLGLDDYDVLYQLRLAGGPARMSDLAAAVLVSRASTTRLVDRLVARGWIERWQDESDRRVVMVALSPEGRRVQARAARRHLDGMACLVGAPLAGQRADALAAALEALSR